MLVHGWGDTAETWQFLVDRLSARRTCIAIDMRGFVRTQRPDDGYWFPDYLADLDALLDEFSPAAIIDHFDELVPSIDAILIPPGRLAGRG